MPRKDVTIDPGKKKIQGTLAYYKVIFEEEGFDKIETSGAMVKILK